MEMDPAAARKAEKQQKEIKRFMKSGEKKSSVIWLIDYGSVNLSNECSMIVFLEKHQLLTLSHFAFYCIA